MTYDEEQEQKIMIICGAQFGSEGKGSVAAWLADKDVMTTCVRVGGPNAGHTVTLPDGKVYKLQQLPVGAVHGNKCLIAAGSEVDLGILEREVMLLQEAELFNAGDLYVDGSATVLTELHSKQETQGRPHGEAGLTASVGSTGKGVGAARSDRIWRRAQTIRDLTDVNDELRIGDLRLKTCDTTFEMGKDIEEGCSILIEGTQGYGLGLYTKYYPFATSGNARAIDFLAQAGLSPWGYPELPLEVWLVARTFPIRVAGNSGPLHRETTWEALQQKPEYTTVTKKVRRVGEWDKDLVLEAIANNGGHNGVRLVLTFLDYVFPNLTYETNCDKILEVADSYISDRQKELQTPITAVSTGPSTITQIQ